MHTRAAYKFVEAAGGFEAEIRLIKGEQAVDGKSILEIMMLAAAKGDKVTITAKGPDAGRAVKRLSALISGKFGEEGSKGS